MSASTEGASHDGMTSCMGGGAVSAAAAVGGSQCSKEELRKSVIQAVKRSQSGGGPTTTNSSGGGTSASVPTMTQGGAGGASSVLPHRSGIDNSVAAAAWDKLGMAPRPKRLAVAVVGRGERGVATRPQSGSKGIGIDASQSGPGGGGSGRGGGGKASSLLDRPLVSSDRSPAVRDASVKKGAPSEAGLGAGKAAQGGASASIPMPPAPGVEKTPGGALKTSVR